MIKQARTFIKFTYIYPLLFSIFPILALYNFNVEYVHYTAILRSIKITIGIVAILVFIANIAIKNHKRAAIAITFVVFLFFIYGHIFTYFENSWPNKIHNRHLTVIWFVILFVGCWWIAKKLPKLEEINQFLEIVSITLLAFAIINAASFEIKRMRANAENRERVAAMIGEKISGSPEEIPDIYYIILDAHARSDVLLDSFEYDNSTFTSELEDIGFSVADCSQTNYWRTEYSLTSTLNLNYLQDFLEDPNTLPDWKYSVVRQTLETLGYTTIGFESRATHNIDLGVDILLSRRSKSEIYEDIYPFTNLNEYEVMLINTTWLQSWLQLLANFERNLPDDVTLDAENAAYLEHYRQTLYILDELQRVPYRKSPKFVMAHLLVPHEPFIFNPEGKYEHHHTDTEFVEGYSNNAKFIDSQMPGVMKNIIERSQVPPIIIVQGDHGPNGAAPNILLPILNAYYLPGAEPGAVYEKITPVNSFRVIFNQYFGMDYEMLDDISYYSQSAEFKDYRPFPVTCPQP
ncbi:MAG: hypothetical protein U9Q82_02730 [Chloroflexota bacterium]|nr:hypothetical protein [Chloroflexota bacterium]